MGKSPCALGPMSSSRCRTRKFRCIPGIRCHNEQLNVFKSVRNHESHLCLWSRVRSFTDSMKDRIMLGQGRGLARELYRPCKRSCHLLSLTSQGHCTASSGSTVSRTFCCGPEYCSCLDVCRFSAEEGKKEAKEGCSRP
jgi:hypothetical protein